MVPLLYILINRLPLDAITRIKERETTPSAPSLENVRPSCSLYAPTAACSVPPCTAPPSKRNLMATEVFCLEQALAGTHLRVDGLQFVRTTGSAIANSIDSIAAGTDKTGHYSVVVEACAFSAGNCKA